MKKLFNIVLMTAAVAAMVSCGNSGTTNVTTEKEADLQKVMAPYVNNTVIATYSGMATQGLILLEKCEAIEDAVKDGDDYTQLMKEACDAWKAMREYWEKSEAFLYGPAANHNIDPHIDSWPLEYNAMNDLLNDANRMAAIEEQGGSYVGLLGFGLKGFHAAEYLLFDNGQPHATNLTKAEAIYLVGIVEDLAQQAVLLEDCWAGTVSEAKKEVLDYEEDSYGENYGEYMINAGKAGSIFVSYQDAAEEIISGCVDIAGEVASLKMGNPYLSSNEEEREYIESPYSHNSTKDFADNIRSIQNAYCGSQAGDASISDFVKKHDADLDAKVRAAIEESIAKINAIQNFETQAKGNSDVKAAIDKVSELEQLLNNEVLALLAK